jgi:photosynthetic reaction center cytochrome c subunit
LRYAPLREGRVTAQVRRAAPRLRFLSAINKRNDMQLGLRRRFLGAIAIACVCLVGVAMAAGQAGQGGPPTQGQNAQQAPAMTEDVFKSVTLLKGIPVDTFFEVMGMFANSMGNDCTFCHVKQAYFDRAKFAEPTPRIIRARGMLAMMNTINKGYFKDEQRVTCFTCHRGSNVPVRESDLSLQYGMPVEDPNVIDFPEETRTSADSLFAKYVQAVGGREKLSAVSSFVARGTYEGFDTAFAKIPVEVYAKAPNQRTLVVKMFNGDSVRAFDGRNGWMAGPDTPMPIVQLTGGNLERARLEALLAFPANIRQAYSQWKVGRTAIDGQEVFIVQGRDSGQPLTNLYFDQSGMLVRLVRWTETPVGRVPTQIDYKDYRDVSGVKMPFKWAVSQTYMQMAIELSEIRPNVAVDAAKFGRPAPGKADR